MNDVIYMIINLCLLEVFSVMEKLMSAVSTKYAQYHTYVTFETKKKVTELFECQVIAQVTDNEKRCNTQGRMIMTLKKCGLRSHLLNLLGQDVNPAQVINKVVV